MYISNIDFEDLRLDWEHFLKEKPSLPFGQLPVLQIPNDDVLSESACQDLAGDILSQSIAILIYIGSKGGLFPKDDLLKSTKCLEVLCALDDIRCQVCTAIHTKDPAITQKMRMHLASEVLPPFFQSFNKLVKQNGNNGYFVGDTLTVADLHAHVLLSWLNSGLVDGLPTNLLENNVELAKAIKNTGLLPKVMEWNVKTRRGSTVSNKSDK